uniref:Amino acid transporter transmembrane domain-containing protein n=1 Tax=Gadus morhua TaxID=8049 RepID=A0A8C5BI08_GADMO
MNPGSRLLDLGGIYPLGSTQARCSYCNICQAATFEGKTSFGMSAFNLSNAIMGSGILGLSYAMSNTGIVLFPILLTAIACLSSYSVHLLLQSAGVVGIRAYEQLGLRAFGQVGKIIAAVIITLHNIGAMSSYLFIVKFELPLVIQAFLGQTSSSEEWYMNGNYLIVIVSVLIILPLALMKHLGYLGYTSGFSLTCMVFFLSSVIYKRFNIPCPLEAFGNFSANATIPEDTCTAKLFTVNREMIITYHIFMFNIFLFHLFHDIRINPYLRTSRRMQGIANVSILGMFVMYLLTAIFGYLTFYVNTESELLHTYSKVDPLDTLILCVRVAVLVAVTLTVPVVLFPIRRALLQLLFPEKPFHWARHVAIAVCLLFCVNLLVILVPNIRDIFGIIGATTAPCLIFILPGLFYIRIVPIEQEPMSSRPKIQAACFTALGFVFMVMSLTFIGIDWMSGEKRSAGGH